MFPSNIVAGVFGFKEATMFEANMEEKIILRWSYK